MPKPKPKATPNPNPKAYQPKAEDTQQRLDGTDALTNSCTHMQFFSPAAPQINKKNHPWCCKNLCCAFLQEFTKLKLGPLLKHSLIRDNFQPSPGLVRIPDVTTVEVIVGEVLARFRIGVQVREGLGLRLALND